MNLFQKPIDSAIQLAKTASKTVILEKNNRLFILVHSKLELHPVFSETPRISTKQSPLDHLHHNQENDLENFKTHTLLGQH